MNYWNKYGGLGQLTQIGMKQLHDFGKYLRKKYKPFLNTTYNRETLLVRSTDVDRVLMSSSSLLSGLYSPMKTFQSFHKDLNWQPIPVHTTMESTDTVCLFIQ